MDVAQIPVSLEILAGLRLALPRVGRAGTSKLPLLSKKLKGAIDSITAMPMLSSQSSPLQSGLSRTQCFRSLSLEPMSSGARSGQCTDMGYNDAMQSNTVPWTSSHCLAISVIIVKCNQHQNNARRKARKQCFQLLLFAVQPTVNNQK